MDGASFDVLLRLLRRVFVRESDLMPSSSLLKWDDFLLIEVVASFEALVFEDECFFFLLEVAVFVLLVDLAADLVLLWISLDSVVLLVLVDLVIVSPFEHHQQPSLTKPSRLVYLPIPLSSRGVHYPPRPMGRPLQRRIQSQRIQGMSPPNGRQEEQG